MLNLERIPDQVGYLLLTEDGAVISSGGEMENDERIASVIYGLITLTDKVDSLMQEDGYKRISDAQSAPLMSHSTYQSSMNICCGTGLGFLSKTLTCLWKSGHPDAQTSHHTIFSCGDMSRTLCLYNLFQATLRK